MASKEHLRKQIKAHQQSLADARKQGHTKTVETEQRIITRLKQKLRDAK